MHIDEYINNLGREDAMCFSRHFGRWQIIRRKDCRILPVHLHIHIHPLTELAFSPRSRESSLAVLRNRNGLSLSSLMSIR